MLEVNPVRILFHRFGVVGMILGFNFAGGLYGAWEDPSQGNPIVETHSNKEFNETGQTWKILQDKLGRLFVGGNQLHVFDGNAWHSFSMNNATALRSLCFGQDHRLWVGATNEVGYFEEKKLGEFIYHSLTKYVLEADRNWGDVWACAQVGECIYFICENRLLRWDG